MEKCVSTFQRVELRAGTPELEEISPRENSTIDHHMQFENTKKQRMITGLTKNISVENQYFFAKRRWYSSNRHKAKKTVPLTRSYL